MIFNTHNITSAKYTIISWSGLKSAIILAALALTACDLNATSPSEAETQPSETIKQRWAPVTGTRWAWQLQSYTNFNVYQEFPVFDIDLFDGSKNGSDSLIQQLKKNDKKVICYFSAGTREDWRADADQFTEASVIANGEMQDWPGETWLDISNLSALDEIIKPIMEARLDLAREAGCDAVEPDNVDATNNDAETHGEILADDQLAYNIWLAKAAHDRGMSIGLKNNLSQLNELVHHFDFAVNEQCYAYGNECMLYEVTFLQAGKAVFNQEYYVDGAEGELTQERFLNSACPYFSTVGISGLWSQGYELNGTSLVVCPD